MSDSLKTVAHRPSMITVRVRINVSVMVTAQV